MCDRNDDKSDNEAFWEISKWVLIMFLMMMGLWCLTKACRTEARQPTIEQH